MAISVAVQSGSIVSVYDEKNSRRFTLSTGTDPKDGLVGYTADTVSVRRDNTIYTYNANGSRIGSHTVFR